MDSTARHLPPITYSAALATDLCVGIAAGLAAAAAMNLFQSAWSQLSGGKAGVSATEKVADAISEEVAGKAVKNSAKKRAANTVHYLTGAVLGGLYGVTSGIAPALTTGRGTLFGGAAWLIGDELAVPGFGLAPAPSETPTTEHGYALVSHLVFGLSVDLARRALNALISAEP